MITNENNEVAMVYHQPAPGLYGGYYFDVRRGVALAWVPKEAVNGLLAIRGGCCGGQKQVIFPANQDHVNLWNGETR